MLGAVPSACSASSWATLTRSMRVAPLFQQTLGGLKVGVDRRLAAHGFDEFFGNLYHLNAEEEPANPDYPAEEEAPLLRAALLPRGVIHSWATDTDTDEVDPRYGPVGKQRVKDTGPLNRKRMETIDDETTAAYPPGWIHAYSLWFPSLLFRLTTWRF